MPAIVILTLAICLWLYLDNANVAPQFDYCKGYIASFAINLVSKHLTISPSPISTHRILLL